MDINRYKINRDRDPPSFSSTLLDSIYRSIDDSGHERPRGSSNSNSEAAMMMMMMSGSSCYPERSRSVRRARDRTVDRWMEKTTTTGRESLEFSGKMKSSSMSSSDSSSGFGFSSSDTDSFAGARKKERSLKPIRTTASDCSEAFRRIPIPSSESERRPEVFVGSGGRRSAKSRAMKFYGDLKRIKQPISPGGKLATFLNSLFAVGSTNSKKQRISIPATVIDNSRSNRTESKSNFTPISTPSCSTASSYTRSCLSKSPISSGVKRSVRFSPLSVVLDEDVDLTGKRDPTAEIESNDNRKSVEEVAVDLMRNYYRKWEVEGAKEVEMIDEQEDDVESCCSADLFELENLKEIGVDRYCAELPVYETTHVNTNRAIASGLIV